MVNRSEQGERAPAVVEISCLEVWREVSNYLDNEVEPELRARIERHLKACHHCTAILEGTSNTVRLLADGEAFDLPRGFSDRLYNKLSSELQK